MMNECTHADNYPILLELESSVVYLWYHCFRICKSEYFLNKKKIRLIIYISIKYKQEFGDIVLFCIWQK